MTWVDALGWFGSALLVFSLLQARILRLRVLNTVACAILVVFNAALAVWPMVAMNVVLAVINGVFIVRLLRERRSDDGYAVLEVAEDDAYLAHFLRVHRHDIARFFPEFAAGAGRAAYLVQRGDETAGAILVRDVGGGTAQVELDYVTPRFRDLAPGEFVYRRSGLFRTRGFERVLTPPGMVEPYYGRLGFARDGDHYRLDVA
ncbi:hypothetical protein JQN72_08855 [Phycicoccus sp. CSK15P-2]|uniref:hypothetical protein n=1 Tax=Phycicoccus sp. CSK15P-2 TaxID=2807627 RepID=UPI001951D2BF|nr:hypothetical protein [Phycicoccus sp. CSK15P-2]MBM6404348.1 hypothetical protein [Phycicoccus sp. CSK15P-2]